MIRLKHSVIFLFAFVIVGAFIYIKLKRELDSLPSFIFYDLQNRPFENTKLINRDVLIIYISTECGSCNQVLESVKQLAEKYTNTMFTIVSSNSNLSMSKSKFLDNKITERINIKLLYDRERQFVSNFDLGFVIEYPTIFYYSGKEKTLKRINDLRIENYLQL